LCGKLFKNRLGIYHHMKTHRRKEPDCDKYYCDLQRFIPHWQRHYSDSQESDVDEDGLDATIKQEVVKKEQSVKKEIKKEKEIVEYIDEDQASLNFGEHYIIECDNDFGLEEENAAYNQTEIYLEDTKEIEEEIEAEFQKPETEYDELDENNEIPEDEDDDYQIDNDDDEHSNYSNSEDTLQIDDDSQQDSNESVNKNRKNKFKVKYNTSRGYKFVRDFFTSKPNVRAFIEVFKNKKNLWEIGMYTQLSKQQRIDYLEEISTELHSKIKVKLTLDQIRDIITYLRAKHRIAGLYASTGNKTPPEWFVEYLSFLPSSTVNASINQLGTHTLKKSQILQMLEIYKQFPYLWDSDLVEYVCNNKRDEALQQMQEVIQTKLNLQTDIIELKRYINDINMFYGKQKRLEMKNADPEQISEYYDCMDYLRDHVPPFECPTCNKRIVHALRFRMHLNGHQGQDETIPCKICGKPYGSVEPYMQHCRRHMDDLPVECKECGKRFIRDADLRLHMRIHTGVKPYCCEICGASFRHSNALLLHTRRHKKLYCHSCTICPRQFYSKDELNNHMDIHKGERNRICKICGKGYKTKSTLKAHILTHETELKHPCELCGKMFKNRLGVYHHMKTHRRKEPQLN
ncbi:uncharacterized protein LOC133337810, partial [Musca vetustissima]|uniref:uncharacterized protein LOC133337810 n=1 Tax=Musca vetustissima TaxID=27455 RepID=UPI002AB7822E